MIIHNVTIFTNEPNRPLLHNQAVLIEGTRIAAIAPAQELLAQHPETKRLDGQGRLLMPGLVNTHMHFYGLYARGMGMRQTAYNFHEILLYLWWALDKVLDDEATYYSALLPSINAVRKGVTSMIDHHASPNACDGSLDRIEEALTLLGVRGLLCYETSDRDGKAIRTAGLAENARFIRKCQAAKRANPDHLLDGMVGLHASFTLDDDTLEQAADTASGLGRGCHIHMLEDFVDETETRRKYGRGVVERLHHFGILGNQSITAHGIFLDDAGRAMLKETDTIIVHQASSNMNNAVGRADVFALLAQGSLVGIGTDGMTADLRNEVRTGYLLHKHHLKDNNAGWSQFEQMTLQNNPAIYRRLTGQMVGQVSAGWLADLILLDYFPPTPFSEQNFWGHFLFGMIDSDVNTTIINGKVVMHDKQIPGIDENELAAKSREAAQRVWKKYWS
jgi:putative selenium metabolism protein SsnA